MYPNCNYFNADVDDDGVVGFADINVFNALMANPGTNALRAALTWDAENRLVGYEPLVPDASGHKVTFKYDYLGRRVEKTVYNWDPNDLEWQTASVRRFMWSGWLLLMELDGDNNNNVVRKYTWGLDLAGQMGGVGVSPASLESAGGILDNAAHRQGQVGGLLAVSDPNDPNDPNDPFGDFVYLYDGNGNVGQVVDLAHDANDPAGALVAKYEYDPYGQRINHDPNVPEYDQPWRFSTKQFDAETGLGYWGYRYYSPGLGRWISRDPIGEAGGRHLYGYVSNAPSHSIDPYGQATFKKDLIIRAPWKFEWWLEISFDYDGSCGDGGAASIIGPMNLKYNDKGIGGWGQPDSIGVDIPIGNWFSGTIWEGWVPLMPVPSSKAQNCGGNPSCGTILSTQTTWKLEFQKKFGLTVGGVGKTWTVVTNNVWVRINMTANCCCGQRKFTMTVSADEQFQEDGKMLTGESQTETVELSL